MLRPRLSCCVGFAAELLRGSACLRVGDCRVHHRGWAPSASVLFQPVSIIRSLKPFTPDLFRAFGGLTNETKLMPQSDADRLVILVLATELSAAGAARKRVWPRHLVDRVRRLTGLGATHLVDSELGRVRWAMSLDLP